MRNFVVVAMWAVGTAGMLAIVQPRPLAAGPGEARKIEEQPKLRINGCDVALRCERASETAAPVLVVTAKNPGKEPARFYLAVRMMTRPEPSEMSRTIPMPKESWQEEEEIELDPYESCTQQFGPKTATATGAFSYFVVGHGKQSVTVFPTRTPAVNAAAATAVDGAATAKATMQANRGAVAWVGGNQR